ncbi:hypothetical protein THIOM_000580 [Candidatus Thiomargarita nelsonii]|uniref:Uncharacterized protein n=1 Tax=Candidatus Thiomargarita nelsonii TaxID=1003181 RepID=A0A176S683_9GAMM|nr:hypothetical protein THIOM_000580 [Candidatus Thiomargarita nelsonii]
MAWKRLVLFVVNHSMYSLYLLIHLLHRFRDLLSLFDTLIDGIYSLSQTRHCAHTA